jgi:lysophospholipase L1-like esterase
MRWASYVAVGDSFTEGLDDPAPDGAGFRGWADLVALRLAQARRAAEPTAQFRYANLAVRGRLFDRIVDEQVPMALRMQPDLVSFAGGGNDVLRRNFDPATMLGRFDEVIRVLRASSADVIIFRWADVTTRLPGRRLILPRMQLLNRAVAEAAQRHGAMLVDLWHDQEFHNPRLWSEDRLHMAPAGHRRVAAHVLAALGVEADPTWLDAPGPMQRRSWVAARAHDARWARQHLAPWLRRRLRGTSSGDSIAPKRPDLFPLDG